MSSVAGDCLTTHSLLQLTNSLAGGHLIPTSYSSHCHLKGSCNHNCSSLCSFGMACIENTSPNSSIVMSCSYRTDCVESTASHLLHCCVLQICFLATDMFAEPLPSNSCLFWLHSSCLDQICQIYILMYIVHISIPSVEHYLPYLASRRVKKDEQSETTGHFPIS
jgi:hypothetical protein